MLASRPWAHVRTAVVLAGLGFVLVAACLDYAGEDFEQGCPDNASTIADAGADAAQSAADCDAGPSVPIDLGSGSGAATPP